MSATNTTTNYSLPLFIGTDKPAWLVDWNGAMTDIDSQMKVNATAILANETAINNLCINCSNVGIEFINCLLNIICSKA